MVTERFVHSISQSVAWPLAPICSTVHFWGLLYIVLIVAASAQQCAASLVKNGELHQYWYGPHRIDLVLAADPVGFGSVASYYENEMRESVRTTELTYTREKQRYGGDERALQDADAPIVVRGVLLITRVLLENCCQLWLQASLYCLLFDSFSNSGRIKQLFSLALGLFTATTKSLEFIPRAFDLETPYLKFLLIGPALSLVVVAWAALKLVFAHYCESHEWNLTSGCVDFDPPASSK